MSMIADLTSTPSFVPRAEILDTFDGDEAFVGDLVVLFLERAPMLLEEMRAAAAAGDGLRMSQAAHSLKGSLGYFEQGMAHATILQIEQTALGHVEAAAELLPLMERHLATLTIHLTGEFRHDA